jgi:hypothetical protein
LTRSLFDCHGDAVVGRGAAPDDEGDLFDIIYPEDDAAAVVLTAYLDESGREVTDGDRRADVFAVAGYIFTSRQARDFKREWKPFFSKYGGCHMKELVHRVGAFKGIEPEERDRLVKGAVRIIRNHALAGVVTSCWVQEVEAHSPDFIRGFSNAYSILCHMALSTVGYWARLNAYANAPIAFFIENGQEHRAEADDLISLAIRHDSELRRAYQYRSHTFADRKDVIALQAADVLAWEWTKFVSETAVVKKRPMRRSFGHLVHGRLDKYRFQHFSGEKFIKYLGQVRKLGLSQLRDDAREVGEQPISVPANTDDEGA